MKKCIECKSLFKPNSSTHKVCLDCRHEYRLKRDRTYQKTRTPRPVPKRVLKENKDNRLPYYIIPEEKIDMYIVDETSIIGYKII